jgi:hypothetical protein
MLICPTRKYCSGDRKVLVFGAPKIVEILKIFAFWHSLVSPRVLSRETWEKIRARGLRTLTVIKISLFRPLCSVGIAKNHISNWSFFAHSYIFFHTFPSAFASVWIIRKIASEALGKRFDFLLGSGFLKNPDIFLKKCQKCVEELKFCMNELFNNVFNIFLNSEKFTLDLPEKNC